MVFHIVNHNQTVQSFGNIANTFLWTNQYANGFTHDNPFNHQCLHFISMNLYIMLFTQLNNCISTAFQMAEYRKKKIIQMFNYSILNLKSEPEI